MSDSKRVLWVVEAGVVGYDAAVALQERVRLARHAGVVPDVLLLLEHPAVITLGRAAHAEHLLADPTALEARGVQVRETARGGDVTYHGPGQLVGYPIFDLTTHGRDVHRFVRGVEEAVIVTLARYGIAAARVPGLTGVWVGDEKVAAIGIGVRQWVSWHGFALNVTTDMDAFKLIVPCGIPDRGVTSLRRLLGRDVPEAEVAAAVTEAFAAVFELIPISRSREELEAELTS